MKPSVTVIMPSYNRAHILKRTIPTYLQKEVFELIIVDDCSQDNTEKVVIDLQRKHSQIKYIRNEVNSKQPFSKNIGIEHAEGTYIYFADDDSVLVNGAIEILLTTLINYDVDCVGARVLYTGIDFNDYNIDAFIRWRSKRDVGNRNDICDLEHLKLNFGLNCGEPIEVPVVHACALIKTSLAKAIKFDTNYVGCAYREETDFFIRVSLAGYKIIFQPNAVQINLPAYSVGNTGAHSGGVKEWINSAIYCNKYFINKNWNSICNKFNYKISKDEIILSSEKDIYILAKNRNRYKIFIYYLKKIYFNLIIAPRFKQINF